VAVAPLLAQDVLRIATENTVFVMAPAALGSVIGLVVAPLLARVLGRSLLSACGLVLFALGTAALGLASEVGDWLTGHPGLYFDRIEEISSVPGVVTVVMALAVVLGFAFAATMVAVRTLVNERTPPNIQGRVFATQLTLADAASLGPLLAAGAVADVVGVSPLLVAAGLTCLCVEVYLWRPRTRTTAPKERVAPTTHGQ
jgi:MFS family permease